MYKRNRSRSSSRCTRKSKDKADLDMLSFSATYNFKFPSHSLNSDLVPVTVRKRDTRMSRNQNKVRNIDIYYDYVRS